MNLDLSSLLKKIFCFFLSMTTVTSSAQSAEHMIYFKKRSQSVACIIRSSEICGLVKNTHDMKAISDQLWGELLGKEIVEEIDEFKAEYRIPYKKLRTDTTWNSLKTQLDTKMIAPISGVSYSWQKFRDIDRDFKGKIINKALIKLGFKPLTWMVYGTVGYLSDIDNVAIGSTTDQEVVAKVLADTLNYYLYNHSSAETFDEESYTQHPGSVLQTSKHLETKEGSIKYAKIALSLSQLQIIRNLKHAHIMNWKEYKYRFTKIFQEIEDLLESVEKYENILVAALQEDEKTVEKIYHRAVPVTQSELTDLFNLKAIFVVSHQIQQYMDKMSKVSESLSTMRHFISNEEPSFLGQASKKLVEISTKEKDDLFVQHSLLASIQGTFFPESYFSQEAFQLIVASDFPRSQLLTLKTNQYIEKNRPRGKTLSQVREEVIADNPDMFVKTSPFTHIVSMGEQLGYFIHKVDTKDRLTFLDVIKGGKYLDRYTMSFSFLMKHFEDNKHNFDVMQHFPELTKSYAEELQEITETVYPFMRGKIYWSQNQVHKKFQHLIHAQIPTMSKKDLDKLTKNVMAYVSSKTSIEALSASDMSKDLTQVFDPKRLSQDHLEVYGEKLQQAFNIRIDANGLTSNEESLSLLLNVLLGKARHENPLVKKHYHDELNANIFDLGLDSHEKIEAFVRKLIVNYMNVVRVFYFSDENEFDPYSINYNEISLNHTFSLRDLIPD